MALLTLLLLVWMVLLPIAAITWALVRSRILEHRAVHAERGTRSQSLLSMSLGELRAGWPS